MKDKYLKIRLLSVGGRRKKKVERARIYSRRCDQSTKTTLVSSWTAARLAAFFSRDSSVSRHLLRHLWYLWSVHFVSFILCSPCWRPYITRSWKLLLCQKGIMEWTIGNLHDGGRVPRVLDKVVHITLLPTL